MDFLNLYRDYGVTLQFGGSDQWGNITAGVELIRRADAGKAHALATPLLTKSDGTKYGKTEGGALWLDPQMMSPYAFHQFWLNVEDEKVGELLRIFTFLSHEEIEALEQQTAEKPFLRAGQKALADEVTTLVHGAEETERAKAAAAALFGGGDLTDAGPATLAAALREAGAAEVQARRRHCRPSSTCSSTTGLCKSKGDARRTVSEGGGLRQQRAGRGPRAGGPTESRTCSAASWLVLRRGKKHLAGVEVVGCPAAGSRTTWSSALAEPSPNRSTATSGRAPVTASSAARGVGRLGHASGSCPGCCAT